MQTGKLSKGLWNRTQRCLTKANLLIQIHHAVLLKGVTWIKLIRTKQTGRSSYCFKNIKSQCWNVDIEPEKFHPVFCKFLSILSEIDKSQERSVAKSDSADVSSVRKK